MNDVNWPASPDITEQQSYSWIILNAVFDRLVSTVFFKGFTCKRINRALPIEAPIQIPFLGVYLSDDVLAVDGDPNAGDIRFSEMVTLGFQVVIKNNDPVGLLRTLDAATWLIMRRLLRDNTLTNRLRTTLPGNTTIEGFPRGRVRERWGMTGGTNETPVGERLLELAVLFRTEWYPSDFSDLERITVTTAFPVGGDTSSVEQVRVVYEFTPDYVPPPLPADPT
jgi:hypothetical protein